MLMSIYIYIYTRINTTTTTRTNTRNRNFLKNKTKYTTRNKIFALACHQRRGLAENPNGDGNGNTPTRVCAWDPLTMVINQFPIMQLSETRVSNKNTRGHFTEPPHLPYRQLLISPYCRWSQCVLALMPVQRCVIVTLLLLIKRGDCTPVHHAPGPFRGAAFSISATCVITSRREKERE